LFSATDTLETSSVESQHVDSACPPKLPMKAGTRLTARATARQTTRWTFILSYSWRSRLFFTIQEYME